MVHAHRRMGRECADDNETFRRAGHCNRPTMRLLGSSRWVHAPGYPYRRVRTGLGQKGERRASGQRNETERKIARYCYHHGRSRWIRSAGARRNATVKNERVKRATMKREKELERETEGENSRGIEKGREREKERTDRCGYGYVATPRGASQRALRQPTIHLTPQWADPRSYTLGDYTVHCPFPLSPVRTMQVAHR